MSNVDYTFLPRRRAQVFVELNNKEDVLAAAEWLEANVPEKERDEEFTKYLIEELKKHEPTD